MGLLITLVSTVAGIAALVCWIMTIVAAFKNEEGPLMGILSICPCIGFILGWVNVGKWNHQTIMVIWSICIVINIILNIVFATSGGGITATP